jgi:predicted phage tail protein
VILHGEMRNKFGEQFSFDGKSPQMLFSAMINQLPGFRKYIADKHFAIHLDDENIVENQLGMIKDFEVMHVAPVIAGSGNSWLSIIAGAAIITAAVITQQWWAVGLGASLLLGGVAQMLSPTPSTNGYEEVDARQSFGFDGARNVANTGIPVPLLYGRMRVGSVVVSQQLEVNDIPIVKPAQTVQSRFRFG